MPPPTIALRGACSLKRNIAPPCSARKFAADGAQKLTSLPVTGATHTTETTPVLFGHDWLQGKPVIAAGHAACLDYSVAKQGFLTAYRWSGEAALSPENVVCVRAWNEGGLGPHDGIFLVLSPMMGGP
jgi:hypothetical protein